MLEGTVIGGWGFITAAYVITTVVLTAYAVSLFARLRRFDRKDRNE